jgi:hypothetical protein
MRIGQKDAVWIVTDPGPLSEMADVLRELTLADFELVIRGYQMTGELFADRDGTIYTERKEAEKDARRRLERRNVGRWTKN